MCQSCIVTDIFSVEYCHDLEIWVIGHSRSQKMVSLNSLGMVFHSYSIATTAVSVAVLTDTQPLHDSKGHV